jgi:hypothetical protein
MKNSCLVYQNRGEENKQTRENICLHIQEEPNKLKHARISRATRKKEQTNKKRIKKSNKIKRIEDTHRFPV